VASNTHKKEIFGYTKEPTEMTDHLSATFVIKSFTAKSQCKNINGGNTELSISSHALYTHLLNHHHVLNNRRQIHQYWKAAVIMIFHLQRPRQVQLWSLKEKTINTRIHHNKIILHYR
jgi:hypothetical protein